MLPSGSAADVQRLQFLTRRFDCSKGAESMPLDMSYYLKRSAGFLADPPRIKPFRRLTYDR